MVVGSSVGTGVGSEDGSAVGRFVGIRLGSGDGSAVGCADGCIVGKKVGLKEGVDDGCRVGSEVGGRVGEEDGSKVGKDVGVKVGTRVGVKQSVPIRLPVLTSAPTMYDAFTIQETEFGNRPQRSLSFKSKYAVIAFKSPNSLGTAGNSTSVPLTSTTRVAGLSSLSFK